MNGSKKRMERERGNFLITIVLLKKEDYKKKKKSIDTVPISKKCDTIVRFIKWIWKREDS